MKSKCIVKQQDIKDCGICCLESIIKYYDGYVPLETLRLDTKTGNNGTTAYNLIVAARKYGFNAIGQRMDKKSKLDKSIMLPAIAHITTPKGLNHFVVIYKVTSKHITIMDPSKGYVKKATSDFIKEWNNIILIFKPYKKIPLYKLKNNINTLFLNFITEEKSLIIKLLFYNLLITIFSIVSSYYLQVMITSIDNSYINTTTAISIIFLIISILKIYYTYQKNNISIYLNKNIDLKLTPDFLNHIINLPLNVIKSRTSGEIITRVQELNNIKTLFSEVLMNVILDIFLILCSSIFLYVISKELFFILCIISLLFIIVETCSIPIINKKINDNIDLDTEFNSKVSETLDSLESSKNLNILKKQNELLVNTYTNYEYNTFKLSKFLNNLEILNNVINDLGLFAIITIGIYLIIESKLSLISLITFNSIHSYFINSIKEILSIIPKYYHIKLSFIKISEFLSIEEESLGYKELFINGDIVFNNISYSYDNYKNILNNINLTIKENDHLTIKGHTGSGKSTLFKMLNHNINDYKGNITINSINIKDYSLNTLRTNILYISQKEKLYNDTILNNITLSKNISKTRLNDVLKLTKVNEIIDKKELRLNSFIYDNGFNLSGGERQRIILARAILLNPKILILDESLSEVDKNTEKEILSNIDKLLEKTTIIYISHSNNNYFNKTIEMEKLQ